MSIQLEPCVPPVWALTGHSQTLLGHLIPSELLLDKGKRVEVELGDGDRLVGRFLEGKSKTIVYFFHGLAGNTDAAYMHRSARVAQSLGHSVFLFNHRGCGEGAGLATQPYHSGRAEDVSKAIEFGRAQFPKHRHLAVGFSLSGNALLLLLTGKRGTTKPDAAIAVNAPINLQSASRALKEGLNRIYDFRFVFECRREITARHGPEGAKRFKVPFFSSIYEFDNLYTAPASGFRDRDDYYDSCSTMNLLEKIDTPTIILTAKDDPFVHFEHYERAKLSKHVHLHAENHGGHMGYLSKIKTKLGNQRWMDYALHTSIGALT
ncbi:MAG: alpha/beta fold hydrolase [Bdellovibrionia bacterium]